MRRVLLSTLALLAAGFAGGAQAGLPTYELTIRDGHFEPSTIEVPARQRMIEGPGPAQQPVQ